MEYINLEKESKNSDYSEKELGNFYIIYRYEDFQIKLSGLKDGSIFYVEQELE